MVIKATFNNISAISWQSVLLVEETGVPGENHRHHFQHYFSYIMVISFIGGGKRSTRTNQTTDLLQVTDKLHHRVKPVKGIPNHPPLII
jgi:hypothetical protein